jgi:hypothetical protein
VQEAARTRRALCALLALITLGANPAIAVASSGHASPTAGVHVDPGSPTAKEYSIPLANARGGGGGANSGGSKGGGKGGSSGPQLFGSGITKAPAPANGTTPSASSTPSKPVTVSRHRHHHRGAQATASNSAPAIVASQTQRLAPAANRVLGGSGGGSGLIWMFAAGAIVLLIGAFAGARFTQRSRRTAPRAG